MTLRSCITLGLVLAAQSLTAQGPTIDSSSTAARRLIPVLDDYGELIPENEIARTMREPKGRKLKLVGATLGTGITFFSIRPQPPSPADCSIYEPCTPREKYYRDKSFFAGALVGFMLGYGMLPDESIDRWQAVQIIRSRRRFQHNATTPP